MIQFTDVCQTYPNGYQALKHLNFTIKAGELVLLTGPSGAGKSSIFKLLLRLSDPSHGKIFINNHNIADFTKDELPHLRRYIGMVFQHPQLLLKETTFENVALPLLVAGYRPLEIKRRTLAALQKVGLEEKAHQKAQDLSSGEQKRAEIARAIVTTPKILLVDEPSANVDANTSAQLLNLFNAFHQVGITVIIATHNPTLLLGKQRHLLNINKGVIKTTKEPTHDYEKVS